MKKKECNALVKDKLVQMTHRQLIYEDSDCDGIPNIDDPHPFKKDHDKQLNEISLLDEINGYNNVLKRSKKDLNKFVSKLKKNPNIHKDDIKYRSKNLPSLLNKLRRKRLQSISDIAGAKILVNDEKELFNLEKEIKTDFKDYIKKEDNYYEQSHPSNLPYYAVHFDILYNSTPIELQLKTKRMNTISSSFHTAYKTCDNIPNKPKYCIKASEKFTEFVEIARKADKNDKKAKKQFDELKISPKFFLE